MTQHFVSQVRKFPAKTGDLSRRWCSAYLKICVADTVVSNLDRLGELEELGGKRLAYNPASDEMVITVHRWFTNKSCPGDWLYNRLGDLAARVTTNLGGSQSSNNDVLYRVQTGAFSVKENADRMLEKVKAAGFDTYMIQVDGMYKIQVGAYSKKENADAMANKLKAAGFDTFITTHGGQAVSTTSTPTREVTIGSAVRLKKGAKTYSGGSLASFVYERNHQVTQLSGDRAVISYKGTVVAAVHKDDLILV